MATSAVEEDRRPAVGVDRLHKTYTGPSGSFEALRELSFTVPSGQLLCLVGPSGCGKTTLLKAIAGLIPPSSGRVELASASDDRSRPGLAMVFQEYGRSLFPWMTARENVELPLKGKGVDRRRRAALAADALAAVGLASSAEAYPWQLSGGMQQRVAIARAVAFEAPVLLMDEPFAAVDAQTRADLEDLVRTIWARLGLTIIFVTHDIDEAVYLGERILVLSASPTVVLDDIEVDLPRERSQSTTRSSERFAHLRSKLYARVQEAKRLTGAALAA